MGLLDLFTGQPQKDAAAAQQGATLFAYNNLNAGTDAAKQQAAQSLQTGYGDARTDLGTGYGAATGAINQGATGAQGYIDQGQQGAMGQLGQGRSDLTAGGGAYAPLSALASKYGAGADMYGNALGLNGASGTAAAQGAFNAGPGYQWQMDQGLDAVARGRNAHGMLNSGNTDVDLLKYGQGLANQSYGQWLDRLSPYNQYQLQATQGAAAGNQQNNQALAGLDVTGANLLNTGGQNRAQIASQQGGSLADIANRYYGGMAANDVSQGGALAANDWQGANMDQRTTLGLLPGYNQAFKDSADATMAGQKNALNLGMQAATAIAGAGMGMPGGNLGLGGIGDASMWNKSLPSGSLFGAGI